MKQKLGKVKQEQIDIKNNGQNMQLYSYMKNY